MKDMLFWITIIIGIILGIYVGGWLLFIKPIVVACAAYDAGTLTGSMIGWTIIKCLVFAPIAAKVIMNVALTIAKAILD
jgi:hypothetical protein